MKSESLVWLDALLDGDQGGIKWVQDGIRRWRDGGGAFSLERALRLPTTHRQLFKGYRDAYLILAAKSVTDSADPWTMAAELERHVRHFLSHRWPAWKRYKSPPEHASTVEKMLFQAQLYKALPKSKTQLYAVFCKEACTR